MVVQQDNAEKVLNLVLDKYLADSRSQMININRFRQAPASAMFGKNCSGGWSKGG